MRNSFLVRRIGHVAIVLALHVHTIPLIFAQVGKELPPPVTTLAPPSLWAPQDVVAKTDRDREIGTLLWEIRDEATLQILVRGNTPVHLKDVLLREEEEPSFGNPAGFGGRGFGAPSRPRLRSKILQLTPEFSIALAEFSVLNLKDKQTVTLAFGGTGNTKYFGSKDFDLRGKTAITEQSEELGIELKQMGRDWQTTRTDFKTDVMLRARGSGTPNLLIHILKGSNIAWPSLVGGKVVPN